MLCFGIDSSSMCRFRDIWFSLGTENQEGFRKSSDHSAWCMLFKPLPTLPCWERSPSPSDTDCVCFRKTKSCNSWDDFCWELTSWLTAECTVVILNLQVCPTLRKRDESTKGFVCVHLFILNFCCGESLSLSSKSSQPDTELLFQRLFSVCTE